VKYFRKDIIKVQVVGSLYKPGECLLRGTDRVFKSDGYSFVLEGN